MFDIFRFLKRAARSEREVASRDRTAACGITAGWVGSSRGKNAALGRTAPPPPPRDPTRDPLQPALSRRNSPSLGNRPGPACLSCRFRRAAGMSLANAANAFTAQLQSGALAGLCRVGHLGHVARGRWALAGRCSRWGLPQTSANGNRVDFNYGTIDEWYVNGPRGLEQGFTLPALPQSDASGLLTLELALGGDLTGHGERRRERAHADQAGRLGRAGLHGADGL